MHKPWFLLQSNEVKDIYVFKCNLKFEKLFENRTKVANAKRKVFQWKNRILFVFLVNFLNVHCTLLNNIKEQGIEKCEFYLVHFLTRLCVANKTFRKNTFLNNLRPRLRKWILFRAKWYWLMCSVCSVHVFWSVKWKLQFYYQILYLVAF